jgi:hypothetical protein
MYCSQLEMLSPNHNALGDPLNDDRAMVNGFSAGRRFSKAFRVTMACRDPYRLCSEYVLAPFAWTMSVRAEKSEMFLLPVLASASPAEGAARRSLIRLDDKHEDDYRVLKTY